jgi:hypothetical protein
MGGLFVIVIASEAKQSLDAVIPAKAGISCN